MLGYLEQLQRSVDYIEDHLDEPLPIDVVAAVGGISRWHFQRIFRAITGDTVKAYIRARRLSRSLLRLHDTDQRILDIALLAGFESQESFSRAFKKAFALSPGDYRKRGRRSAYVTKVRFDEAYMRHVLEGVSLTPEILDAPPRQMVGLETRFFGVDSEKNNLGEKLPLLWQAFLPRLPEIDHRTAELCYGVVVPTEPHGDELTYVAAAEVTRVVGPLPANMVHVTVPAATYARFTHAGRAAAIDQTVSYIYATWLAQSAHRHTYGPDLEIYGPRYHPTSTTSVIDYAIPIEASA